MSTGTTTDTIGFEGLKLNRQLLNAVAESGFLHPTEIQAKVIPPALAGQNIIGIAQTGTGKTAAYILPLLRLLNYPQGDAPRALIIAPTRELTLQITSVIQQLGKYTGLRALAVFGGKGFSDQKKNLEQGCDIVTGTPAQVLELYYSGHLILKKVKHFVMDEAERLMDLGFKPQLHKLLEVLPRKRQNLLFSATFSERVKKISDDFLEFPLEVNLVPRTKTATTIEQRVYAVNSLGTKLSLLATLFNQENYKKVIIFCKSKKTANKLASFIEEYYGSESLKVLHGDKTQQTRMNAVASFKNENIRFLIATDVAARGIDIPGVSHVINFDVPVIYEDYIHRIGRTGRAFASGQSVTFVTPADEWHLRKIEKLAGLKIQRTTLPDGVEVITASREEEREQAMEIDRQKRKDDPTFQGAFHKSKAELKREKKRGKRR